VGAHLNVSNVLLRLDRRILGNNAGAGARGVKQNSVEPFHDFVELATIVRTDDGVGDTQAMQVTDDSFSTVTIGVVGVQLKKNPIF